MTPAEIDALDADPGGARVTPAEIDALTDAALSEASGPRGGVVTPHVCAESTICTCYVLATEPNESCPRHGAGAWPPRCGECGKFLKRPDHE